MVRMRQALHRSARKSPWNQGSGRSRTSVHLLLVLAVGSSRERWGAMWLRGAGKKVEREHTLVFLWKFLTTSADEATSLSEMEHCPPQPGHPAARR